MLLEIHLDRLHAHPANRQVHPGEALQNLAESIAEHGVITPLLVRPSGKDGYQIIAGHRRAAAAKSAGIDAVPCLVKEIPPDVALQLVVVENLERTDLDPVEESRAVRALLDANMEPDRVAKLISRSLEWVELRQGLLDLPEEAIAAIQRPRDDSCRLSLGAAAVILAVPQERRKEAVQLVLHPSFQTTPLDANKASATIDAAILAPLREQRTWERESQRVVLGARQLLRNKLTSLDGILVRPASWEEVEIIRNSPCGGTYTPAFAAPPNVLAGADTPVPLAHLLWIHVAARHGLPLIAAPDAGFFDGEPDAWTIWVNRHLLMEGERARADAGLTTWLDTGRKQDRKPHQDQSSTHQLAPHKTNMGEAGDDENLERPPITDKPALAQWLRTNCEQEWVVPWVSGGELDDLSIVEISKSAIFHQEDSPDGESITIVIKNGNWGK